MPPDLRAVGRVRLDLLIELLFGVKLWSVQRRIARAMSRPRARVIVKSCNSSGKTFLDPALALAFFSVFPDSKVITTSGTREQQLKDAFWGELRRHHRKARIPIPGTLMPSDMYLHDGDQHIIRGMTPSAQESLRGYHAPQVLVIGDEASSITSDMMSAIMSLMASGDARLLLTFNPTTEDTPVAELFGSPAWESITIRAWDTPNLSHLSADQIYDRWGVDVTDHHPRIEPSPPDADLLTPEFLDELRDNGEGPGSYEWDTKIEAKFWGAGTDQVVPTAWYEMACEVERDQSYRNGPVQMAIDLASYGDSETVVGVRRGNRVETLMSFHNLPPHRLFPEVIRPLVQQYQPSLLVWDAEGPGAGSYGDAEKAVEGQGGRSILAPFRGQLASSKEFFNQRAQWYWNLRRHFETGDIVFTDRVRKDPVLRRQCTQLLFKRRPDGKIQIETKHEMHQKGIPSPDRADMLMMLFAFTIPEPKLVAVDNRPVKHAGDNEQAFWDRQKKKQATRRKDRSMTLPKYMRSRGGR